MCAREGAGRKGGTDGRTDGGREEDREGDVHWQVSTARHRATVTVSESP